MDNLFFQFYHVGIVNLPADGLIQSCSLRLRFVHGFHGVVVLDGLYFTDDLLILGRGNLRAVLPVYFVAVVLRGIVAGCNHDSRRAAQSAQGKRELRCGAQGLEHIGLDAVGRQAQRRLVREIRGHETGIIGDGHALLLRALPDDIVSQALGGLSHSIDIHTVGARADNPTQSAGTKFQFLIEAVLDLRLIVADRLQFLLGVLVEIIILQPEPILVHIAHC